MSYYTTEGRDEGRCEMIEAVMIEERKERKWKAENDIT